MAELYENKDKTIVCPKCKRFLAEVDRRDNRQHRKACQYCHKWIWFVPCDPSKTRIKEIPPRQSSSGKRFY